jgi:8-oxo-dGTP diphosphatase
MPTPNQPKVGVGVLLIDESGRLLLTLRLRPPEVGCWSIVGGKLDFLETLEQCAIRETLEEVGAVISIDSLLCVTDHLVPAEGQHWVSPAFLARVSSRDTRNCEPEKTREVRWFPIDALPPNLTTTARSAVDAYKRRSPQGPTPW